MEQKILQLQPFMFGVSHQAKIKNIPVQASMQPPPPPPQNENVCGDKDISPQKISEVSKLRNETETKVVEPTQSDTLLWCCYILLNSLGAYKYLTSVSSNEFSNSDGLDFRRAIVDEIVKNPKKIKSHSNQKITKVALEEIKSNLLTCVNMKIPDLIVFCVYYNKNIMVVFDNKIYMNINNGITDETCDTADETCDAIIFYNSKTKKYSILPEPQTQISSVSYNRNKLVEIEQYTKPVRGFSCYKTSDLEELYKKLFDGKIDTKPSKKEMYESIHKEIMKSYPLL